ncbi:MAG: class I SAM-dependent methyltransferase [Firmicutes bacterium]|nr:class I SAM-dependent methyltransferase [Bacillota bacterium]
MPSYSSLALLYDGLMAEVDYCAWARYIDQLIRQYGAPGRRLLDLGCGTGTLTINLHQAGYDTVGIDLSYDMLAIAANKGMAAGLGIEHWRAMDMRDLRFPNASFDVVLCACDGFNYLAGESDLNQALAATASVLAPDGLLLFDVHTKYKMQQVFTAGPFVQECEAGICIWSSQFDTDTEDLVHEMTIFIHQQNELWRRYEEVHRQHYFSPEVIKKALAANGFSLLAVLPWGEVFGNATATTERLQYIARRCDDSLAKC